MSNTAFLETLAGCQQAAEQIDHSGRWAPPDGDWYLQVGKSEVREITKKDGTTSFILEVPLAIVGGDSEEFNGRVTRRQFWFDKGVAPDNPTPSMREISELATCLTGEEIKEQVACFNAITAAEGEAIHVKTKDCVSKAGNPFTRFSYKEKMGS